MTPEARLNREHLNGFVLGVLHAAWFLNKMHGEDQLATELLRDLGPSVASLRRLAHKEQFTFKRGFWSDLDRRFRRTR